MLYGDEEERVNCRRRDDQKSEDLFNGSHTAMMMMPWAENRPLCLCAHCLCQPTAEKTIDPHYDDLGKALRLTIH